LIRSVPT